MRMPVNEPGPQPNASASSSVGFKPASRISSSIIGKISFVWCLGASSKRSLITPSIDNAAEQASVAVSTANNFIVLSLIGKKLVHRQYHACGA